MELELFSFHSGNGFMIYYYNANLFIMTTMILIGPDALEKEHNEIVHFLTAKLYESDKLTLGKADEIEGIKKLEFCFRLALVS